MAKLWSSGWRAGISVLDDGATEWRDATVAEAQTAAEQLGWPHEAVMGHGEQPDIEPEGDGVFLVTVPRALAGLAFEATLVQLDGAEVHIDIDYAEGGTRRTPAR